MDNTRKSAARPSGHVDCYGTTDAGTARTVNDDQFLIAELSKSMLLKQSSLSVNDQTRHLGTPQGQLFLVADGVGPGAAGDRASTIAVDTVANYVLNMMPWFFKLDASHGGDLRDELKTVFEECQANIRAAETRNAEGRRMGVSLTMAYVLWPNAYIVHSGTSGCFLLRGGQLEQVTRDPREIDEHLLEENALKAILAGEHRVSHVLWNALGAAEDDSLVPEVYRARLDLGDVLLLATDGLVDHVSQAVIQRCLESGTSAKRTAGRLVGAANEAGGDDNVTVVVAKFEPVPQLESVGGDDCSRAGAAKSDPSSLEQRVAESGPERSSDAVEVGVLS